MDGADQALLDTTRNLVRAFEQLGARAVLSVQADIRSEPAVQFTRAFYGSLGAGDPVDVAVRTGRGALFDAEGEPRTWALPSLTVQTSPDDVLPIRLGLPRDVAHRLIRERYGDVRCMVDRTAEHRQLARLVDALPAGRRAVIVTGDGRAGKSALVRSWLITRYLRGDQVSYVNFADLHRMSWLDVLREVGAALLACVPERAAEPHRRFSHEIAYLREGQDPPPAATAGFRTDDGGLWEAGTEREPQLREEAFAATLRMLTATAGDRPLLLAIDQLAEAALPNDVRDKLEPGLLLPIARGEAGPVTLIAVERRTDELFSPALRSRAETVVVRPFVRSKRLLRDLAVLKVGVFDDFWRQMTDLVGTTNPELTAPELYYIAGLSDARNS